MSKFLTVLGLTPEQRLQPPPALSRLKTVQEWAAAALDAVKDNTDFTAALKATSPWADAAFTAAKDTLPPVKFVVKVFEELTKVQEPIALARLACTLAYQAASEEVLTNANQTARQTVETGKLPIEDREVDFENFTLEGAISHPFVQQADRILGGFLDLAGFSNAEIEKATAQIHVRYPRLLHEVIANGKTKEKFDPLFRWLSLGSEGRAARAALRRHAEYQCWLFEKARVLNREPFSLSDVYVDTDCSCLTRGQLVAPVPPGHPPVNPFYEGEENGGRTPLISTVTNLLEDKNFRDAIVIQGSSGSGKSSFTQKLAAVLFERGLLPIRVRLRDIDVTKDLFAAIGAGIAYEDDEYLSNKERWPAPSDALLDGDIFREEITLGDTGARICPYVLILDGWDEISVSVSDGFKERVKDLLLSIRRELLRGDRPRVRVILTGRPSDAVDECNGFFLRETPILTVRALSPDQLEQLIFKMLRAAKVGHSTASDIGASASASDSDLKPAVAQYRKHFAEYEKNRPAPSKGQSIFASTIRLSSAETPATGLLAVLGFPLLAYVALRLLSLKELSVADLMSDPTGLFRRLTDYVVQNAATPSEAPRANVLPRIVGPDLRTLLWRTAAEMTVLGQEDIARDELEARLCLSSIDQIIKANTAASTVTSLMVSFYFKGGNAALGCEFTHKAFREYLFAELIVDRLKAYGRIADQQLPERAIYWKDFDQSDPRWNAIRELVGLLGPQWVSREIAEYLEGLLKWEIQRASSARTSPSGGTDPLPLEKWCVVRTFLADAWDWWAEGVHLRPQPAYDAHSGQLTWLAPAAEFVVPRCSPIQRKSRELPQPVRLTTLDSHLGDGLFRLCAFLHSLVGQRTPGRVNIEGPLRRYQSFKGFRRFKPHGDDTRYFEWYTSRINAAGWRPQGPFPASISLADADYEGLDFRGMVVSGYGGSDIRCSYCNKGQQAVAKLICAPQGYRCTFICDECVAVCNSILDDEQADSQQAKTATPA